MKTCNHITSIARPETVAVSVQRHEAIRLACGRALPAFIVVLWNYSKTDMRHLEAGR